MGILSDIVDVFVPRVVNDINAQTAPVGNVFDIFTGGIWDWVGRQTTTAEERVTPGGIFGQQPGDVVKVLGNVGQVLDVLSPGTLPTGVGTALGVGTSLLNQFQGQAPLGGSMAVSLVNPAPCPVGPARSVPAGTCVTIGDWQKAGMPRGFEVAGISGGNTLILRKKGRRRSRRPLPPSLVAQFAQLKDQLGPAMAKTIINRMRF